MKEFLEEAFDLVVKPMFGLIVIFLILAALLVGLLYANGLWLVNGMQDIGFEARMSSGSCVAKVDGKWLLCDVVLKNTQNINVRQGKE